MCLCVCWCWCVVVRVYCKASKVLQQYEHMPSFHGIQQDCQVIVQQLRARLMQQFHNKDVHNTHLQLLICFFADHFFSHLLFFVVHIIFHNSLCFPEVKFCLFLIWGQHPSRWYFVKCLKFGPCRPLWLGNWPVVSRPDVLLINQTRPYFFCCALLLYWCMSTFVMIG